MLGRIGFIGSGKMAEAMIKALSGDAEIISSDKDKDRLNHIQREYGTAITTNNSDVVEKSKVIVLAVKPQHIDFVLEEIKDVVTDQLIVSIAAGVTLEHLEGYLKGKRVIRVMPNTPCLVGEMAAGFAAGKNATEEDIKTVGDMLKSAGNAFPLEEKDLDVVTGLSGSGPAFLAYVADAMIEGGVSQGLNKDVATELTLQTMVGTGKLLQTGISPKELISMVSSPGGTTIAGRGVLEKSDLKDVIIRTIKAATERSRELGKS